MARKTANVGPPWLFSDSLRAGEHPSDTLMLVARSSGTKEEGIDVSVVTFLLGAIE
jgi:hypothetical protein